MTTQRTVEIFSAGCGLCDEAIGLVNQIACGSCEITILDMNDPEIAERAKRLGVRSVPAVAVDGKLVDCCASTGPDEQALRAAGVGVDA